MAHRTITTMDYLIKTQFTPEFNEDFIFFNNKFLEKIYKNRIPAMGSPINGPIRVRRASGSTAAIAEGASHPTAAQPTDYRVTDTLKIIDTHKTTSQLSINLTRSGALNYRTALADNIQDTVGEHGDYLDRAMFCEAGYMADCAASGHTSSTVIRMRAGTNMRQFYIGQAVSVFKKSTGTIDTNGVASDTVAAIGTTSSDYDLTLTTGVGVYGSLDTTDGVCALGAVSTTTNMQPHGIPDLIGTGTLHGVTTTAGNYPEFKAVVEDKAGADFELIDLQKVIDNIELVSKGTCDFIELSDDLYRLIQFDIADPQIQREGSAKGHAVGTGPIRYRGRSNEPLPIYICAYSNPTDDIYVGDSGGIQPYCSCFAEWMEDDGKYLTKVSGSRHYETSLGTEIQNLAHFRTRLGKITNCALS